MTTAFFPDWQDKVVFSPNGPQPQVLFEDEKFKTVIAGLEPGQQIPLHPEGAGVFYFLQGTGTMLVGEERLAIKPGATVIVSAGIARGMQADTRLAFLATRML